MKITKFEELVDKVVPWFIAVCLFIILWAVTGCEKDDSSRLISSNGWDSAIKTITIDDCEYLIWDGYNAGNMIHKANCKNPIHRCE